MKWDVFCRVIDNHGDLGVCWRLARDLASRGDTVRLWVDDAAALAWMGPEGVAGVEVHAWSQALSLMPKALADTQVVVEAFGCDLPKAVVVAMAAQARPPVWINLEYLSAEAYVERSHRLASPQMSGPGGGLTKWFYYPGFTRATGGLIRERDLQHDRALHDRAAWLAERGLEWHAHERVVTLFCYPQAPIDLLSPLLADRPTLLLATPGAPVPAERRPSLRVQALPYLSQPDFDRLLWSADLNFVRGEDSFVRAQWAGRPFVWHIYPQDDGAHAAKLQAFLDRHLASAPGPTAAAVRRLWWSWNGLGAMPDALPDEAPWTGVCTAWHETLAAQEDLVTALRQFASESR